MKMDTNLLKFAAMALSAGLVIKREARAIRAEQLREEKHAMAVEKHETSMRFYGNRDQPPQKRKEKVINPEVIPPIEAE